MKCNTPKLSLIILLIAFHLFSCNSNRIKFQTDLEKLNLKGTVKHIVKTSYVAHRYMGEIKPGKQISEVEAEPFYINVYRELYFNRDGNIEKQVFYNGNVPESEYLFKYDKHGRLINYSDNSLLNVDIKYYDKEKKSEEYRLDKRKYSRKGVEVTYYNEDNTIHKIELIQNGKVVSRTNYTYDEYGHKKSENIYDITSPETPLASYTFVYSVNGALLSKSSSNGMDNISYAYNKNNNLSEVRNTIQGLNILTLRRFEYKYDKFGNWIERIEFETIYNNETLKYITIRNIEYY